MFDYYFSWWLVCEYKKKNQIAYQNDLFYFNVDFLNQFSSMESILNDYSGRKIHLWRDHKNRENKKKETKTINLFRKNNDT